MIGFEQETNALGGGAMCRVAGVDAVGNLPFNDLVLAQHRFLQPMLVRLPEKRLRKVAVLAIRGILASHSPLVTRMARGLVRYQRCERPMARRFYRFLWNTRFSYRDLLEALYEITCRIVARYACDYLLVAIDPVNFEKAYTEKLEAVSTVMKSTPPGPRGQKRLTSGYPAITATIVNLPEPGITYANWFSYWGEDFISETHEIHRALLNTRQLFPHRRLCFLGDAGLDDQKIFRWATELEADFIIRVSHRERLVEIYNDRLDRWETESLGDLADTVFYGDHWQVSFTHAHQLRQDEVHVGWFALRLPDEPERRLWALVADDVSLGRQLILLTSVPILDAHSARTAYDDWRHRPHIEHTYRFDQERGLDVEDMQVHTLERMRRLFALVLIAALFVYYIANVWPEPTVRWLLDLGGKLHLKLDADGPYLLLAGIKAVFVTVATLAFAVRFPFPRESLTYG
jgi:hypothetical protein